MPQDTANLALRQEPQDIIVLLMGMTDGSMADVMEIEAMQDHSIFRILRSLVLR